jgi:undecaprenyl phosphate N,N'-diacetylbacillosamine 1-phosphate transferase
MKKGKDGFYCRYVKRVLDIVFALLAMMCLCWLYAIVALIVLVGFGSPVIFRQQRPGKDERIFTLYKFRTMTEKRDENGDLLPDESRLTKLGRLLRRTSLDELPQLLNVVRGDMSIVGPRPLMVRYLPYYTKEERHRHDVRPGLTGLAQINGRNSVKWEERFDMDLKYTKNVSFTEDLRIVASTIKIVMARRNIDVDAFVEKNGIEYLAMDVERIHTASEFIKGA